jgi:transglutaminase-like putative cysteine protease
MMGMGGTATRQSGAPGYRSVTRGRGLMALLWSPKAALAGLIVVAAWSLSRCFVGPGEAFPAIVAGLIALWSVDLASRAGTRYISLGVLVGTVGALVAFMSPIWITMISATTVGWPTFSTFHVIGHEINESWLLFNQLRAPVPEATGFTIIGAWAVAVAALLAGWAAVDGDSSLWVVAPPAAIFLFTSALGTPDLRGPAIAVEVIALVWYAAASRSARLAHSTPVAAPLPRAGAARQVSNGSGERRRSAVPVVVMVIVAALLAAIIGPRLPGALSPALVSLRTGALGDAQSGGLAKPPPLGQVEVSTLVQVAEEEIYQSSVQFFTVQTAHPSYMVLTTLDTFDGNKWSASGAPDFKPLPPAPAQFQTPTAHQSTSVQSTAHQSTSVQSTISIESLGGSIVPAIPTPSKGNGSADLSYDSRTETVETDTPLEPNMLFYIDSTVPALPPSMLAPSKLTIPVAVQADLQLPPGVPATVVNLAHQIVAGATTPYEKALLLQNFFQSGQFRYHLPQAQNAQSPVATGGEGLADLVNFLFTTKSGFCQQYSSAYAVLARIDGLPTRIAVGFTTPLHVVGYTYAANGHQVHAWPQVYLGGAAGWTNFEPTPNSHYPNPPAPPARGHHHHGGGTGGRTGSTGSGPNLRRPAHQERGILGGSGTRAKPAASPGAGGAGPSSIGGLGVLYGMAGVGLVVFGAAPLERAVRRRRARSPAARVLFAWRSAIATLGLVGLAHHRGESFNDLAQRVSRGGILGDELSGDLNLLADASTVAAFSPTAPTAEAVKDAVAASRRVTKEAHRRAGPWKSFWFLVSPRSLLDREDS